MITHKIKEGKFSSFLAPHIYEADIGNIIVEEITFNNKPIYIISIIDKKGKTISSIRVNKKSFQDFIYNTKDNI